jgi:hypothetical protein
MGQAERDKRVIELLSQIVKNTTPDPIWVRLVFIVAAIAGIACLFPVVKDIITLLRGG